MACFGDKMECMHLFTVRWPRWHLLERHREIVHEGFPASACSSGEQQTCYTCWWESRRERICVGSLAALMGVRWMAYSRSGTDGQGALVVLVRCSCILSIALREGFP